MVCCLAWDLDLTVDGLARSESGDLCTVDGCAEYSGNDIDCVVLWFMVSLMRIAGGLRWYLIIYDALRRRSLVSFAVFMGRNLIYGTNAVY